MSDGWAGKSARSFEEAFLGLEASRILATEVHTGAMTAEQQASLTLESRIAGAFVLYAMSQSIPRRRKAWSRFRRLCAERSPEQIARMERARGLAP